MNKKESIYNLIMSSLSKVVFNELKRIHTNTVNEGVESKMSLTDVMNVISPFGWTARRNGVRYVISKGPYTVTFHIKHNKTHTMDVGSLDQLRTKFIEEFLETNDPETINSIPWNKWLLTDPFKRELKDYDRLTGQLKTTEEPDEPVELSRVEKMRQARTEKSIQKYNELLKDAVLLKIDYNNPDSAYIMMDQDSNRNVRYNTCRSEDDRRALLKVWMDNYRKDDNGQYLGKIDWRNATVKYYKLLSNGTIEKTIAMTLDESLN